MSAGQGLAKAGLGVLVCLFVVGCQTPSHRPSGLQVVSPQTWFSQYPQWSVNGRVALSDGEQGGQLNLDWQADHRDVEIKLSTRLGGQWWALAFDDEKAVLRGHDRPTESQGQVDALVLEATGWPIPVKALNYWVRGLDAPPGLDPGLTGWQVDITQRQWVSDASGQTVALPQRLEARRDNVRIRVVFGRWDWGKSHPSG